MNDIVFVFDLKQVEIVRKNIKKFSLISWIFLFDLFTSLGDGVSYPVAYMDEDAESLLGVQREESEFDFSFSEAD